MRDVISLPVATATVKLRQATQAIDQHPVLALHRKMNRLFNDDVLRCRGRLPDRQVRFRSEIAWTKMKLRWSAKRITINSQ